MQLRAVRHVYRLYRGIINVAMASGVVAVVLTLSLIMAPTAGAINIGGPSDCDNNTNSIVNCGVHSTGAVISAYNSSAYVRAVYAYFGISQADIANLPANNVAGRVTKDGNVFIDGQPRAVATDAITAGRHDIPGSTQVSFQGTTFFKRPPSVSFQQDSLPAFVSMNNGRFQFAIIASCGNPVRAAATVAPQTAVGQARAVSQPPAKPQAQPATTPAPTQTQTQSQSQEVNVNNTNINAQVNHGQFVPAPETVAQTQPAAPAAQQPATQPASSTLVNTGPTGTVGIFLASTGLGVLFYRKFILRQLVD